MPSQNFYTFMLAKERNATVGAFLTGQLLPFSQMEHYLWTRHDMVTRRLEQQNKGSKGKGRGL